MPDCNKGTLQIDSHQRNVRVHIGSYRNYLAKSIILYFNVFVCKSTTNKSKRCEILYYALLLARMKILADRQFWEARIFWMAVHVTYMAI